MKTGKISETVLKRSVLRQIKPNTDQVIKGAAVGADCALVHMDHALCAVSCGTASYEKYRAVSHAIYRAANNLAAGGAKAESVLLHLVLPMIYEEADLKNMMKEAQKTADILGVSICGGQTEVLRELKNPLITVTAIGAPFEKVRDPMPPIQPGDAIVMTKWIGLGGTAYLAKEKEKELSSRFPSYFIKDAQEFEQYYSILPEAATAVKSGVCTMHDVSRGGIFGALWELGEQEDVGLTVELKDIPVKQETIEICEFFDISPYEFSSDGSLLMVTHNASVLEEALRKEGIKTCVIGMVTEGRDRIVRKREEKRFLEPPRTDEIYKVIYE